MSRFVMITGAGSGIGRASALALAAKGYSLGLLDIDMGGLERTAEMCADTTLYMRQCDVTDEVQVHESFKALTRDNDCHILVNSAGIARYGSFDALSTGDWRRQFEVNVLGTVNPIRAALPSMLACGRGLIVNVGSRRGLEPKHTTSAYSASKAAIHALTRSLNEEFGSRGISVSYLAPGGTNTGLDSPKDPRFMEAATVGEAVAYMCDAYPAGWVRQLEVLPPGL